MNQPILINEKSFQNAWKKATKSLITQKEIYNLVVHIKKPLQIEESFHTKMIDFARLNSLLSPKDVAYTIFPINLYKGKGEKDRLFTQYNKEKGFFDKLQSRPRKNWGTYFRRMTNYETKKGPINQLNSIIESINRNEKTFKAAYTMNIKYPSVETKKLIGTPCLNYIAIQIAQKANKIGVLCIYRNHDFLERAYGNYWGLCKLINFLALETNKIPGPLTCISSHAYIDKLTTALKQLVEDI
jgi:thymidylate synthase